MAGSGKGRGSLPLNAEINVTSLVDVAFTLLVIFIITAPILQGGVEVQLPRAEAAPIAASDGVIVTVTREGAIYIGDLMVKSAEDFETIYPQVIKGKRITDAYLRADADAAYGRVAEVLGLMKKLDVAEVALVVDEPEKGR